MVYVSYEIILHLPKRSAVQYYLNYLDDSGYTISSVFQASFFTGLFCNP